MRSLHTFSPLIPPKEEEERQPAADPPPPNPQVRTRFMAFLRDTASSPDTQNALVSLSLNILQHPDVLKDAVELGKEVWAQLVKDPKTLDQLTVVLVQALADERSKEAVVGLIQRLAVEACGL